MARKTAISSEMARPGDLEPQVPSRSSATCNDYARHTLLTLAIEVTAMFAGLPLSALHSFRQSRLHAKADEPCDVLGCLVQSRTIGRLVRIKNWLARTANSVSNSVT